MTEPNAFKVLQIDHVELFVPDQHEAARWYKNVLGLEIVAASEQWACDGGPLMISSDGGSTMLALFRGQPTACPETAAFRRVAFRVTGQGFAQFLDRLADLALVDSRGARHARPDRRPRAVVLHLLHRPIWSPSGGDHLRSRPGPHMVSSFAERVATSDLAMSNT